VFATVAGVGDVEGEDDAATRESSASSCVVTSFVNCVNLVVARWDAVLSVVRKEVNDDIGGADFVRAGEVQKEGRKERKEPVTSKDRIL